MVKIKLGQEIGYIFKYLSKENYDYYTNYFVL